MQNIKKYFMTLALLLTAVTGAWADEPKVYDSGDVELFSLQVGDILLPGVTLKDNNNSAGANIISNRYSKDGVISQYSNSISSIPFSIGENGLLTIQLAGDGPYNCMPITEDGKAGNAWVVTDVFAEPNYKTILIGGTTDPNTITVTPVAGKTNEWTFTMPAYDVEIAPIYAPTAVFATDGNQMLTPTPIEGIIAGEAKDIVKAGTVAKVGSTENAQGTLMYLVTTTKEQPTSTTGFNATVPTGAVLTGSYTENQTVYVWYYIKGIDAAEGETATAENTFNDSEICAEPLQVTVLSNKFDIQFNAANANTIEAGKATVKVGENAAEVKEGKLTGVKMNSKVTVTAKEGYKFRKVEVKKVEKKPELLIVNPVVGQVIGSDGKNYAYGSLPTGVTAVAKICYVSGSNGLALALTDEGKMNWSTAQTTCAAHTAPFTGGTWKLASQGEWNNMISAAGNHTALRDGFSSVGGTNMHNDYYWSSTEDGSNAAMRYRFDFGSWSSGYKTNEIFVRACLAF